MTTSPYRNAADRVMVFIDGSNLYHSLQTFQQRVDLDYGKFATKLSGERRLLRTYYYGARVDQARQPERYQGQQRFFDNLERLPRFELRLGQLLYSRSPEALPYEKGVDVRLTTDVLLHAARNTYDVAVLVSGDTDFVDLVQGVKDLGKNIEVVLFDPVGSQALRKVADEVIEAGSRFLGDCWRR